MLRIDSYKYILYIYNHLFTPVHIPVSLPRLYSMLTNLITTPPHNRNVWITWSIV